jgi:hypothetical protein
VESIRVVSLKIICDLCFFYPPLCDVELSPAAAQEDSEPVGATFASIIPEFLSGICSQQVVLFIRLTS